MNHTYLFHIVLKHPTRTKLMQSLHEKQYEPIKCTIKYKAVYKTDKSRFKFTSSNHLIPVA